MKPHPRIRKTIKWGGAAVTMLLVVVSIASGWYRFDWTSAYTYGLRGKDALTLGISGGAVHVLQHDDLNDHAPPPPGFDAYFEPARFLWSAHATSSRHLFALIPMWPVVLLAGFISISSWRLDTLARRRAKLNLCPKCNYDRTGLLKDVKCPECGAAPTSD